MTYLPMIVMNCIVVAMVGHVVLRSLSEGREALVIRRRRELPVRHDAENR